MFNFEFKSIWNWFKAEKALEAVSADLTDQMAAFVLERYRMYAPVDTGFMVSTSDIVKQFGNESHVVVTAYYAYWVEMGHLAGATWVPPQPALRNALAAAQLEFPSMAAKVKLTGEPRDWLIVSIARPS